MKEEESQASYTNSNFINISCSLGHLVYVWFYGAFTKTTVKNHVDHTERCLHLVSNRASNWITSRGGNMYKEKKVEASSLVALVTDVKLHNL
jgi:hypothetical protein